MTNVIGVYFNDFKKLAQNHRIYYYKGDGFYDFQFLVDGMIVKSTVLESQIPNPQQFFSDALFYGAMQLTFQIAEDRINALYDMPIKKPLEKPIVIENILPEEVKQTNIQREGVDMDLSTTINTSN